MRTRALAFVALAALALVAGRRAMGEAPVLAPPACADVVGLVEPAGERISCASDPALADCSGVTPGWRYRGCERVGPLRGAVLRLHGLPLDANRATADDLRALEGVGEKTAAALVEARRAGPFCTPADLARTPRIGLRKATALAAGVSFDPALCPRRAAE